MLTPNGRFTPNRRLCLSMSDYHPESWNPMWSLSTILTGLYSFMIESNPTLGSIETTLRQKRQLALSSLEWNVKNDKSFCKLFPEYLDRHEEEKKTRLETGFAADSALSKDGLRGDGFENIPLAATLAGLIAILSILMAYQFL
jgi:ubiquitin-conjugating enzyme E2 J2